VPDADDYEFTLKVNGEVKQRDNVKNAFFSLGELVEYLSYWMTLMFGDIISRGNSSGVGMAEEPRRFLRPGDLLEMEADGIGVMRHEIIATGV
jgi:2-keto-4-pentenoate hydratase/2-oxohepta-3-ene-1,7-dioic acid hydratase in catechol pathway